MVLFCSQNCFEVLHEEGGLSEIDDAILEMIINHTSVDYCSEIVSIIIK